MPDTSKTPNVEVGSPAYATSLSSSSSSASQPTMTLNPVGHHSTSSPPAHPSVNDTDLEKTIDQNVDEDEVDDSKDSAFTRFRRSKQFLSFTVSLAIFVDLLCYGIIMPLTPFIIENLGLDSTANGGLIACYAVGLLVSSPVAGVISDRMANRRLPMVIGLLSLLLSTILFMEAMNHFWVCTMMTLGFALLSDTFPANQLGTEMGKVLIGQSLGLMAGPPLGGILKEHIGPRAPYIFCLILIAIDLIARLLIIEPRSDKIKAIRAFQKLQQQGGPQSAADPQSTTASTTTNSNPKKSSTIKGLLKNKRLVTALLISFVNAFLVAALEPVMPLYFSKRFNLSETQIGLTFLAISLPTFVSPLAGWFSDRHGAKLMSATAVFFCAIFVVAFGIPGMPLWALMIFLVGIGATCAIYITPVLGEISAVVRVTGDGDGFARAFALFNMVFSLGMVAGPLLGSLIYQKTSMLWTCVLVGVICLVATPLVLLYIGGKEQKLLDQVQYEKDMQDQSDMLDRIRHETEGRIEVISMTTTKTDDPAELSVKQKV
ncbi:hypothetical protein BGW38_000700 [Lunasporangiospora selenospora]|uniref:Major facilitator superfamily (MFS) profile domain-containing protein n=1 Tax=Lunasporangiospora selenospora TaxID=979761 RepID=A0A9P6G3Y5_9FUNG|nr:hypothetical protein BGW38_000700 [Lunasporangiospora selenospora]